MQPLGNDRWHGEFPVASVGEYFYTIAGWIDHFDTWRSDLEKRIAAGQDIRVDLLHRRTARRAGGRACGCATMRRALRRWAVLLRETGVIPAAQDGRARSGPGRNHGPLSRSRPGNTLRPRAARHRGPRKGPLLGLVRDVSALDAARARTPRHFQDCEARLDYVARLGFDVLYLPPIHPIGLSFRKGKNNSPTAEPGDTGSPWAIGAKEGGHTAIHPRTRHARRFSQPCSRARRARESSSRSTSPSSVRPIIPGSPSIRSGLRSAPTEPSSTPKIRPRNTRTSIRWISRAATGGALWDALLGVFRFWIDQGVRIFRVDNPHTKAFPFWEWLHRRDQARFSRRALPGRGLYASARNAAPGQAGLLAVLHLFHLAQHEAGAHGLFHRADADPGARVYAPEPVAEYARHSPRNAADSAGAPPFSRRIVLAATLGPNYGIYGPAYELGENKPLRPGSEEYLNSEKYEIRHWNLDAPHSIDSTIATINRARRENPALHAPPITCSSIPPTILTSSPTANRASTAATSSSLW